MNNKIWGRLMENHVCRTNPTAVGNAALTMPAEDTLIDLAELYKVFGDSTRVGILCALCGAELCVCDLAELLGMTHSAISHQLRILRASKLVSASRRGKNVCYALADGHVRLIIDQGLEHVRE